MTGEHVEVGGRVLIDERVRKGFRWYIDADP